MSHPFMRISPDELARLGKTLSDNLKEIARIIPLMDNRDSLAELCGKLETLKMMAYVGMLELSREEQDAR